ncbi:hypothetical protein GQ464_012760 [Rhodocaloribacter litoris]|uniref:hypothetical protein n=1 Tax=Rhodocaloribacter litoris TaxID=2558931 RepID=UPI001E2E017B|nr:hypothetical protein [Rhodocaloribacter litoris]QXD14308.1 hypothetical protein GQ464_012760 [Rhodocaloribacter litoris]
MVPVALLLLVVGGAGCSPSLSPLYRDYEVAGAGAATDLRGRIEVALRQAGWHLVEADAPNVVATEARTITNWGLYKVQASLEVAPLGERHVRVFIHPYRKFFTGGRSKIPYLRGSLRRAILPALTRAFEAQGLRMIGSAVERDEEVGGR